MRYYLNRFLIYSLILVSVLSTPTFAADVTDNITIDELINSMSDDISEEELDTLIDKLLYELDNEFIKRATVRLECLDILDKKDIKSNLSEEVKREDFCRIVANFIDSKSKYETIKSLNIFTDVNEGNTNKYSINYLSKYECFDTINNCFYPKKKVLLKEEAIPIFVKLLGYDRDFLIGDDGYYPKASLIGITSNMKPSDIYLTYGNLYLIMSNILKIYELEEVNNGDSKEYYISSQTFMKKRFDIDYYEEVEFIRLELNNNENYLEVKFLYDSEDGLFKKNTVKKFKLDNSCKSFNADLDKINIFINSGKNVIYYEDYKVEEF